MHFIDNYAYGNHIRSVDPALKAGLSGIILIFCLFLNSPLVGALSVLWVLALGEWLAAIPVKAFGKLLFVEFTFFLLATVGVAVSVTPVSPASLNPWSLQVGPLWFSTSPELLRKAWLIISRVMGCVAAMNFLSLTTPLVDLIALARRMRIPGTVIDLMTLIYRFIFVLLETLETMRMAQDSRMGYVGFKRGISNAGLLVTRLFIETYQRSQRLQIALESRGYEGGDLRVLTIPFQFDRRLVWLGLAIPSSLVLVWRLG